jgi:hypothetical protein
MCTFYTEQHTGVLLVYKLIVATVALHVCAQFISSSSNRSSDRPAQALWLTISMLLHNPHATGSSSSYRGH